MMRLVLAGLGLSFAGTIAWAVAVGDFSAAGTWLTTDPWGIVTLADLYFGFVLSALVIAGFERHWRAVLWILPIPILGNVWTVIWFIVRLPELLRRLGSTS